MAYIVMAYIVMAAGNKIFMETEGEVHPRGLYYRGLYFVTPPQIPRLLRA